MNGLPKRVWLVIILLVLAVISLWLVFLKKELQVEKTNQISLSEALGFNQTEQNKILKTTKDLLDQQSQKWNEILNKSNSTSTASTSPQAINSTSTLK